MMPWASLQALAVGALAIVLCDGCAVSEPSSAATTTATSAPSANPLALDYRINPGDRLQIFVWRNPEASQTVTVSQEGTVTTALLENLPATGKTPSQLAEAIETALAPYIQQARVSIRVTNAPTAIKQRVRVVGEVVNPQAVTYRDNMTVLDAIGLVGGITKRAAGNRATLLRLGDGQQQDHRLRIDDLLKAGDKTANLGLLPGDLLIIPAWKNAD